MVHNLGAKTVIPSHSAAQGEARLMLLLGDQCQRGGSALLHWIRDIWDSLQGEMAR